jgi:hypothetical protein
VNRYKSRGAGSRPAKAPSARTGQVGNVGNLPHGLSCLFSAWLGYFDRELQMFDEGKPTVLNSQLSFEPIALPEAVVLSANYAKKFKITVQEGEMVFVVALKPRQAYEIEVDDEEMLEETTDPGGILSLQLPTKVAVGVRMREVKPSTSRLPPSVP